MFRIVIVVIFFSLSGCVAIKDSQIASKSEIFPIQQYSEAGDVWPLAQQQKVLLSLLAPDSLEKLVITTHYLPEKENVFGKWLPIPEKDSFIEKDTDQNLWILKEGEMIFDFGHLRYDHVYFKGICQGESGLDKLVFQMGRLGTANTDINDILFFYFVPGSNQYEHQIVEYHYLANICDLEGGLANKAQQLSDRNNLQKIYQQLRPISIESEGFGDWGSAALPIRHIDREILDPLMEKLRQFQSTYVQPVESDELDEGIPDALFPQVSVSELISNEKWRIIEASYSELWHSWGVLLAENKLTGKWTSFYDIPPGGSKVSLYLSDEFELDGDIFSGSFVSDTGGWGSWARYVIDLNSFTWHSEN